MTEDDARSWVETRFGPESTEALSHFVAMVRDEAGRQNLIAPSTLDAIWDRHVLDSAQLMAFAPAAAAHWIDIGTGAGFPGIVTGILFAGRTTLIEPRGRRADFLSAVVRGLGLTDRISVEQARAEVVSGQIADVISARAVASIDQLFAMSSHLRARDTTYLLPRGRSGRDDLALAQARWHGMFHVEHSLTDPESTIVVASKVHR